MEQSKFPRELLTATDFERKNYFKTKSFSHAKLEETISDTLERVCQKKDESIICVYGPSGVGKSFLSRKLKEEFKKMSKENGFTGVGKKPVCHVIARAATSSKFSWPEYNRRLLEELNEPMIDEKIRYEDSTINLNGKNYLVSEPVKDSKDLNGAVEKALINRGVQFLLVDETQHIATVSKSISLAKQLDVIKSIANVTETLHILFGTYSLLHVIDLSGQVARRDLRVHFPRYQKDEPQDIKDFAKIVKEMWVHIPLAEIEFPNVDPMYFYDRTIGCVGLLHDWLYRALGTALHRNLEVITTELLDKTALRPGQLQILLTEAREGERLEYLLSQDAIDENKDDFINNVGISQPVEAKRKKPNAFKRKPGRDPVGIPL